MARAIGGAGGYAARTALACVDQVDQVTLGVVFLVLLKSE
jgi:hypothetical protein